MAELTEADTTLPPPPQHYRIRVKGHLGPGWSEWFAGMELTRTEAGETLLSGPVLDQAALHGLLAKIRDLNLTLIAVERIGDGEGSGPGPAAGEG
jgi:hypothetical protein